MLRKKSEEVFEKISVLRYIESKDAKQRCPPEHAKISKQELLKCAVNPFLPREIVA